MQTFRDQTASKVKATLKGFPTQIGEVGSILTNAFPYQTPSEARKNFSALGDGIKKQNQDVMKAFEIVSDEMVKCEMILSEISKWIAFLTPQIEDGNNFGVAIQVLLIQSLK